MASECKLCVLLGTTNILENDQNATTHAEFHARQLDLINRSECTVDKKGTVPKRSARKRQFRIEKSKNPALLGLCHELLDTHGNENGMECSQCKKTIRARVAIYLFDHACIHLNKELFACRQCHLKFISKGGIRSHLRQIHSLNGTDANYVAMTEDHLDDIMDMINLCFGKAPPKQLNVTKFGKQKRNQLYRSKLPLFKLARSLLLEKRQLGCRLQCNLCTKSVLYNPTPSVAARKLVDHARWHLDKPIFTCRLCHYSSSTEVTLREHLRRRHRVTTSQENYKDGSNEYYEEIISSLKDCFGENKKEELPVISKEQERTHRRLAKLRTRCGTNSLLAERHLRCAELAHKFKRSGKLECRICHDQLAIRQTHSTLEHAVSHFNKVLFTCRRCPYNSTTRGMMGKHVRSKHSVPETNEYDDRTDEFHSHFMEMLTKCYDWDLEAERSTANTDTRKNMAIFITSKTHGNKLKAARQVHAYELIRKHANEGKIICRICSQATETRQKGSWIQSSKVFNHALTHLDKRFRPYRCKLCSYLSSTQSTIRYHLKHMHKGKSTGTKGFEDMSDKFHSKIMESLSKCYDWGN